VRSGPATFHLTRGLQGTCFAAHQQRQPDDELASRRQATARRLDLTAVQFDDPTRDAQPQPQPAPASQGVTGLRKRLEDAIQVLAR
jgi:hypothetical protein